MHLFTDYIEPIIHWLQVHPHLALFFAFLASFAESLVLVGSIVPGSVTMTALGILAGSGIMRIDLTLLAAILGAIAGDGISYFIGYHYSDRLGLVWPFKNYPSWLALGKDYFSRHGGKSVLIGRFFGPLRSIIPVIAGMMHMSHWRFFIANVISAILWSLAYVLPGVAIGAASSELSPEIATRLFVVILLFLIGLWILGIIIKKLLLRLNRVMRGSLHNFWAWSITHPKLAKIIKRLTPTNEDHYYQTAALCLGFILSLVVFATLVAINHSESLNPSINQSVYLFLQSLRVNKLDAIMIALGELDSFFTLIIIFLYVALCFLLTKDWHSLRYWLGLYGGCYIALIGIENSINITPYGLFNFQFENTGLTEITFITSALIATVCFSKRYTLCRFNQVLYYLVPCILFAVGLSLLYLGNALLLDVLIAYSLGLSISLFFWLFYRRENRPLVKSCIHCIILPVILVATICSVYQHFHEYVATHKPYQIQYALDEKTWWDEKQPILPLYRTNRIGKNIGLFNIQYAGSLTQLEIALTSHGWKKYHESLFNSLINRFNGQNKKHDLPLMAPLYLNKKPILVMVYYGPNKEPLSIIRLWPSNYRLNHFPQPIFIGSVNVYSISKSSNSLNQEGMADALRHLKDALTHFIIRELPLSEALPKTITLPFEPELLLIKEE